MQPTIRRLATVLLVACCLIPARARATDVDGPNDCTKTPVDFGDAPESVQAYPGVPGHFPTCTADSPPGTRTVACAPISTVPGLTGFVRHVHLAGDLQYWLGCLAATNGGIDGELDGKTNDNGAAFSTCATSVTVDCFETAFGLTFGQDECYGSNDAGVASAVTFVPCATSSVTFTTTNCSTTQREVYLNILVDWNQDGDWNDNFQCATSCAYEWAVKNVLVVLPPSCGTIVSPTFLAGPNAGNGWMRITISDQPVTDDFPWAGSATTANQSLRNGETEDYPITIQPPQGCPNYEDWGDAPEEIPAYPSGVLGHFPTCLAPGAPGTQSSACPPISTLPGPTGFVKHVSGPTGRKFWFGCGVTSLPTTGVDTETDGKVNSTGGPASSCNPAVAIDCVEAAFGGMLFGQDECYADPPFDAGLRAPVTFRPCSLSTVTFYANNCDGQTETVFLNILVDWNEDGDWNDNFQCTGTPTGGCAYEWAVKNVAIVLPAGCTSMVSPSFLAGPNVGHGWMRLTLTASPVTDDFPWAGCATLPGGQFNSGETEDYPVEIMNPQNPCDVGYRDFGDAPENLPAYASGVLGHFPTCLMVTPPGDLNLDCSTPSGSLPGPTGYVEHIALPGDPFHFWLGCAVDDEADGKVNLAPASAGTPSMCDPAVLVDCLDGTGGITFGQDECFGDLDAALMTPVTAEMCSLVTFPYKATLCENTQVPVYLNVLADWNRDGDWNDNIACKLDQCSLEWAVKNAPVVLAPGCNSYDTPKFLTGPYVGPVWMRITLSAVPAPPDFPWNGTAGMGATPFFHGGETEDYILQVSPENTGVEIRDAHGTWLSPVIPNPARDRVTFSFSLAREADVSLSVFDLTGRKVVDLAHGRTSAGLHPSQWDFRDATGRDVPVGFYLVKLRVGDAVVTRSVIRVR